MKNDSLRQAIAREEAQLAELAHKQNESRERLAALKAEFATMESTPVVPSTPAIQPNVDICLHACSKSACADIVQSDTVPEKLHQTCSGIFPWVDHTWFLTRQSAVLQTVRQSH